MQQHAINHSMRICFILAAVLAAISPAPKANAISEVNGLMLLHHCKASILISNEDRRVPPDQVAESNHCLGYVQGIIDANSFWDAIDNRNHQLTRAHYCMAESVTFEQVIRVVVKWLENNPKDLNENGYIIVESALVKAFPCRA
jgi:hypothetical protein